MKIKQNKIRKVTAFKYGGQLFDSREDALVYIQALEDQNKMKAEVDQLNNPITFKIREGYFDFLVFKNDVHPGEPDKRVCYKVKSFAKAVDKVLKRQDCGGLDYEAEILDINKGATGIFIDMMKMPKDHKIHSYIH